MSYHTTPTPLSNWLDQLRGSTVTHVTDEDRRLVAGIHQREPELKGMRDDRMKRWSGWLQTRAGRGESLDRLLPDAFSGMREAARRVLGERAYDCQLLAGLMLHRGRLAEMGTGEGKTLAAIFPAYLNALLGKGVHIFTFNDYLAQRDAAWMGPVFEFLGMSAAAVFEGQNPEQRRHAYAADVTWMSAREAGFDYLRDSLAMDPTELVQQRPFHFAIVDEADSILIDEARVPLVIAGQADEATSDPARLARVVAELEAETDYQVDEYGLNVFLTEQGFSRAEQLLGLPLHEEAHLAELAGLNLALHAATLLHRDVDYIVRDDKLESIDALTGRIVDKRRWPHGLHAALEAKEGVAIHKEGATLGTIALQHFVRLYPKLAGMTATARPSARELAEVYDLHISVIPPNKPCIRRDHANRVFSHKQAKQDALVGEICAAHAQMRPVLIGTASVAESEALAEVLADRGLACQVLNARTHDQEAAIIAEAGAPGAITISTNMAGRGTDIKLGGADERERERVVALGGLLVIGTNLHESRRIDDQLRGRAGRQGDPGESRFIISLEDDLITRYKVLSLIPKRYQPVQGKAPITHPIVTRELARAQRIIEGQCASIRRTLWSYAAITEQQRRLVRARRDAILRGEESAFSNNEKRQAAAALIGEQAMVAHEREIVLLHLDKGWAEHLYLVEHLRDGIHLTRYEGKDPLIEFRKKMSDAFDGFEQKVEEAAGKSLENAELTEQGFRLDDDLKRPSSTWTYLANDNPFGNDPRFGLMGSAGIGYAVFSFFYAPLILFAAAARRLFRPK